MTTGTLNISLQVKGKLLVELLQMLVRGEPGEIEVLDGVPNEDDKTAQGPGHTSGAVQGKSAGNKPQVTDRGEWKTEAVGGDPEPGRSAVQDKDVEMDEAAVSERTAIQVVELAARLDGKSRRMARPTHALVMKMYCCDNMSISKVARKCGCSQGTAVNRKKALEKLLGQPLAVFRRYSGVLEKATQAAEDTRAKNIHRPNLLK